MAHVLTHRKALRLFSSLRRPFSSSVTPSQSKVVSSAEEALNDLDLVGATVCVGGFGLGGSPETLLRALSHHPSARDLTVAALTGGTDGAGVGLLLEAGIVKRLISSYVGENKHLEDSFFGGRLEVELTPQGTLAARMKAAGSGFPAFYTPTGAGTVYANGGIPVKFKEDGSREVEIESLSRPTQNFDGHEYVMEYALKGELSLVKAAVADTRGNLIFRGTAQNANPDAAMAGKMTIVEAEEIVQVGELDPNDVHLPGIYVDKVIQAGTEEKMIERLRLQSSNSSAGDV